MTTTNETITNTPAGEEQFLKGMAYLKGIGQTKDEGLAAANLLDASDLNHPTSLAACALLYFCGIGVTRNTQTAAEFAQKYLLIEPTGRCARIAHEVVDGSLGSQNALKALHALDNSATNLSNLGRDTVNNADQARQAKNKQTYLIAGGAVIALLLVVFVLIPKIGGGSASSEDPEKLFTSDELSVAKQKALERAGLYRTEAKNQSE
ncbi:hypothetical protein ICV01_04210 [Polynucleobacter sp. MWH-Spelu-300-X4]|uniref:hypothetical protein n=1 Tax=Polynucleobacter sp. MWH-Spelu-300-X4 TaxID=2689109 RepID=UPI001BFEDA11|nr:hypothetical protein [Polynucleobacter sp. MWH-Spelu-300-X4]QWD80516.1 hypothetical protein ICV01_04210 [Polynucleobacter sp. MWH-Spelu-300-X4]